MVACCEIGKIPSLIRELMNAYGVSRPTVRAVFATLRNQGLITVLHGKGSFVRRLDTRPIHAHPDHSLDSLATIAVTPTLEHQLMSIIREAIDSVATGD